MTDLAHAPVRSLLLRLAPTSALVAELEQRGWEAREKKPEPEPAKQPTQSTLPVFVLCEMCEAVVMLIGGHVMRRHGDPAKADLPRAQRACPASHTRAWTTLDGARPSEVLPREEQDR